MSVADLPGTTRVWLEAVLRAKPALAGLRRADQTVPAARPASRAGAAAVRRVDHRAAAAVAKVSREAAAVKEGGDR